MRMEHQFTVPVPVEVAWSALTDPQRVAPCMPGATLTRAEGNEFAGSVKVKLGPVSLLYKGSGSFTDINAEARRAVIDASGKDARGNGTAAATVTAELTSEGSGTVVQVSTDLKVTGRPAQLGRGMISDVAGKIIDQFADCLAQTLTAGEAAGEEVQAAAPTTGRPVTSENGSAPSGTTAAAGAGKAAAKPATRSSWKLTGPRGEQEAVSTAEKPAESTDAVVQSKPIAAADAIDLLETAKGPVLKRLAPLLAAAAAIAIAVAVLRRRRRG